MRRLYAYWMISGGKEGDNRESRCRGEMDVGGRKGGKRTTIEKVDAKAIRITEDHREIIKSDTDARRMSEDESGRQ